MSAPVQPRRGGQNTTPSDLILRRRRAAPGRGEQCRPTRSDTAALSPDPERQHPSGWNTTRADSVARQRVPSILGWTTPSEFRPSRRRTSRRSSRWRASRDMLWRGDSRSSCPPATPPTRRRTRRRSSRCRASRDILWRGDSSSSCPPAVDWYQQSSRNPVDRQSQGGFCTQDLARYPRHH